MGKAYLGPPCKFDHVTNSVSESFNNWLGDKAKNILSFVKSLNVRLMGRFSKRYDDGYTWNNYITPKIKVDVDKVI